MSTMVSEVSVAEVGALVGDPARAKILSALVGGQALTASELGWHAGVSASTVSEHLAKLTQGGLLTALPRGRHRYFRLASPLVARMLESIAALVSVHSPPRYRPRSKIDDALRAARTCYDHLAGRLGVALADALVAKGYVALSDDGGVVTRRGERFFAEFGVDLVEAAAARRRRCFCRPCLDWSERRPHLAGTLGAKLAERCFDLDWVARIRGTRALAVTRRGVEGLWKTLEIRFEPPEGRDRSVPRTAMPIGAASRR